MSAELDDLIAILKANHADTIAAINAQSERIEALHLLCKTTAAGVVHMMETQDAILRAIRKLANDQETKAPPEPSIEDRLARIEKYLGIPRT